MLPMTIAENGEILNLSQIVRVEEMSDQSLQVTTVDGITKNYKNKAADILRGQCLVNVNLYQNYLKQITSPIVPANGKPKIF